MFKKIQHHKKIQVKSYCDKFLKQDSASKGIKDIVHTEKHLTTTYFVLGVKIYEASILLDSNT
jgi:hypothetical protein